MSAALAVQAHPWGCRFAYVGGTERTKNDVGVVVSGKEQVLHVQNPWEALGYQAVEEATVLFNQGALAAAGKLLDRAMLQVQDPARKRELLGFKFLAHAYDAWDRFDHRHALNRLAEVQKFANDLVALLGRDRAELLDVQTAGHRRYLAELLDHAGPTPARVKDLLANARRRAAEGRHDDAVARLYRAIEAIAQVRLREAHSIDDTGHVPPDRLPEGLARRWSGRVSNGTVFLGLRDDYVLLLELGDELGKLFQDLKLDDRTRSPLVSRNQSILAHGFDQVGDKVYQHLWDAGLRLAALAEGDLPAFPRLGREDAA
jgi:CRISPR-associated protein (TIGR02710 family)